MTVTTMKLCGMVGGYGHGLPLHLIPGILSKILFSVSFAFQHTSWRIFWALFGRGAYPWIARQFCYFEFLNAQTLSLKR